MNYMRKTIIINSEDFTMKTIRKWPWLINYKICQDNKIIHLLWATRGLEILKIWEE